MMETISKSGDRPAAKLKGSFKVTEKMLRAGVDAYFRYSPELYDLEEVVEGIYLEMANTLKNEELSPKKDESWRVG